MPTALLVKPGYPGLIRNTPGLVAYWRMRDLASSTTLRNELTTGGLITLSAGAPVPYQGTPIADGAGVKFNGTSDKATCAPDISAYSLMSLSFWLWNDTNGSAEKVAIASNSPVTTGNTFLFEPRYTSAVAALSMVTPSSEFWVDTFPQPSAAAWHHYVLIQNRATGVQSVYVDGVTQTMTPGTHTGGTYGNYTNNTWVLMHYPAGSLFWPGRMAELAVWGGIALTANDARNQYQMGVGWG